MIYIENHICMDSGRQSLRQGIFSLSFNIFYHHCPNAELNNHVTVSYEKIKIISIFLLLFWMTVSISEDFPCQSFIKESVTNTVKRLGKKHHKCVFPYHPSCVFAASGLKLYKWKLVWFMSKTIYKISHGIHRETESLRALVSLSIEE